MAWAATSSALSSPAGARVMDVGNPLAGC
jgi:hypothetical protein